MFKSIRKFSVSKMHLNAILSLAIIFVMLFGGNYNVFSTTSTFAAPLLQTTFNANLENYSSQNFPFLYMSVTVSEDGIIISDLPEENFKCYENGVLQTDYFAVTPPLEGGGVRLADIVFLIDTSGSMGGEITSVRNQVSTFTQALANSDIDYRLGLVQFGNSTGPNPMVFNNGILVNDVAVFQGFINTLYASGGYEPGFLAIRMAIQQFNFRPGSQKVFILISDEDSDDRNKQETIDLLQANDVTVHTAVNCSTGTSQTDYCDESSIRGVTGGLLFNVVGPYDLILDTIAAQTALSYIVKYQSSTPIFDGNIRVVTCDVSNQTTVDTITWSYIPGAAPRIERTPYTISLHQMPHTAGSSPIIQVRVTDLVEPYVQDVALFYKLSGSSNEFSSVEMDLVGTDLYEANIPSVQSPGVDYYIRATDGQVTSSLPYFDPGLYPFQLAVLPNVAPVINHTPLTTASALSDLKITANIVDTTNYLNKVELRWRYFGDLIFRSSNMENTFGDTFEVVLPGNVITKKIEYYIWAIDDLGVANTNGTSDFPHLVNISSLPEVIYFGTSKYSLMGDKYTVSVVVKNTSTVDISSHTVTLIETPPVPIIGLSWSLDDTLIGSLTSTKPIPSGETTVFNFELSHEWNWIPPLNTAKQIIDIFLKFLPLTNIKTVADISRFLSTFFTTEAAINAVNGIPERTYKYTVDMTHMVGDISEEEVLVVVSPMKEGFLRGALVAKLESFLCGLLPWPLRLYALAGEAMAFVISPHLYSMAYDPDPNFTEIAYPEPVNIPQIEELDNGPGKEYIMAHAESLVYLLAAETSYYRYAGAKQGNSPEWMKIQLDYTIEYLTHAMDMYSRARYYQQILVSDLPTFTKEDINVIKQEISTTGLPSEVLSIFQALGYDNDDAADYLNGILEMDSILAIDPPTLLVLKDQILSIYGEQLKGMIEESTQMGIDHLGLFVTNPTVEELTELDGLLETVQTGIDLEWRYQPALDSAITLRNLSIETINRTNNLSIVMPYYEFAIDSYWELQQLPIQKPPIANANGPYAAVEGVPVTLDASGSSDPENNIVIFEWDLNDDGLYDDATGVNMETTFWDNGEYIVGLRVTDAYGESDTDNALITVYNENPTANATPVSQVVQYSDKIVIASFSSIDVSEDIITATSSWNKDNGEFNQGLPKGLHLTNQGCMVNNGFHTCAWTLEGIADVPDGVYIVRMEVYDDDGGQENAEVTISVEPEDVIATYTGPMLVSTGCAECTTAMVPLRATIQDITAVMGDPAYDPDPGNITNATVTFVNREGGAALCSTNVILLDPADTKVGTAACDWLVDIGNSDGLDYTVGIIVDGYYTRNSAEDDALVVVSKPTSYFITGGGYLINQYSSGIYAGDPEMKTNFGINVKFDKKLKNLKGRATIIVRNGESVYQIKSNALASLAVVPYDPDDAKSGIAELISKANITDVTDPLYPIEILGNATLQIKMEDNGEPGSSDLISITLWGSDGSLLFSSNWSGVQTIEQLLDGGNLQVH